MDIKHLHSKVDKLDEKLDTIDKTLVRQEAHLEHHIYRTSLNEDRLLVIEESLKPLVAHVSRVDGSLKFIALMSLCLGIVATILKIVGVF